MIELLVITLITAFLLIGRDASGGGSDTLSELGGNVNISATVATVAIARAIATAEGFFVEGSRPQRNHNPGDMTADLIRKSTGRDGMFVIFANDEDGWNNLYAQVNAWLDGTSIHAGPGNTIQDISKFYTTTEQDIWASNVAGSLGVDVLTPIGDIA